MIVVMVAMEFRSNFDIMIVLMMMMMISYIVAFF